ncbi:glucosaminidase domain-containing protein [Bacteroidales bacterium OttesenSCG-928-M06]|nr:glucosaminidase domain-containing protein [Bacteroidales bacterium OttesenSCG-928-M06]
MKAHSTILFFFSLFLCISCSVQAQKLHSSHLNYINKYSNIATDQMKKHKIPASITLAQGILESGAGQSAFVKESNNHFGIKCHTDWKGNRIYRADDGPNDCFRSYKKVEESFEDHSRFLANRARYSELFKLDITDYKGWARGLQKCGYATDKAYANKLIKLIDDYKLYEYDKNDGSLQKNIKRQPFIDHGLLYIVGESNDSYERIAEDMGFKVKDLLNYNEVPANFPVSKGDIIYLQKKNKQAEKPYFEHIVQIGESMHSISQRHGMQVERLYKLNKKKLDYVPTEGDVLRLR